MKLLNVLRGFLIATLMTACASVLAAPIGPTYPAPGGNNWTGNGVNAANGTAVWNYSNFDTAAFSALYFGLNQLDYGPAGAGLNGTADPFSLFSVSGQTAEWRANTTWFNSNGVSGYQPALTRLVMSVSGLGATPWTTNLASLGLGAGFGDLGAVVDNSAGLDFTLTWRIEGNTGSGWQALNSIQQHISHNGKTRSSVASGFYYEQPVPAPSALILLALGLVALGLKHRQG